MNIIEEGTTKNTTVKVQWGSKVDTSAVKNGDPIWVTGPLAWVNTQEPRVKTDESGAKVIKDGEEVKQYKASVMMTSADKKRLFSDVKAVNGKKVKLSNAKEVDSDEDTWAQVSGAEEGSTYFQLNMSQNSKIKGQEVDPRRVRVTKTKDYEFAEGCDVGNGSYGTLAGTAYVHQSGISFNFQEMRIIELVEYQGSAGGMDEGFEFEDEDEDEDMFDAEGDDSADDEDY